MTLKVYSYMRMTTGVIVSMILTVGIEVFRIVERDDKSGSMLWNIKAVMFTNLKPAHFLS